MLRLDFINVGYGDAILIREDASGFRMLVDAGDIPKQAPPGSARTHAAAFLAKEGIRTLDLLVLTHLHLDHVGGLPQVLQSVRVRQALVNYLPPRSAWGTRLPQSDGLSPGGQALVTAMNQYLAALDLLRTQQTDIRLLRQGITLLPLAEGLSASAHLEPEPLHQRQAAIWEEALSGRADPAGMEELDQFINNTSIRLRLACRGGSVELPGDTYAACWERHDLAPATLIKLPHHGHRDSLSEKLLAMLRPQHAVISVSNSRQDDCPAPEVIRMLTGSGCQVHFTDALSRDGIQSPARASVPFHLET